MNNKTDLLKHDKMLSKKAPPPHLRDLPDYLLDPTTKEVSKSLKLARAAMGCNNSARGRGSKRNFRKNKDPLKSFSAEVSEHISFPALPSLLSYC